MQIRDEYPTPIANPQIRLDYSYVNNLIGKEIGNDMIKSILTSLEIEINGSMITRELRAACGFNGKGMRSKFDGYLTRLEMATYIVTEDFVYPRDKHNREYGWGWSLLNTPESLYGKDSCHCSRTPEESYQRIFEHIQSILPKATDKQIAKLIG